MSNAEVSLGVCETIPAVQGKRKPCGAPRTASSCSCARTTRSRCQAFRPCSTSCLPLLCQSVMEIDIEPWLPRHDIAARIQLCLGIPATLRLQARDSVPRLNPQTSTIPTFPSLPQPGIRQHPSHTFRISRWSRFPVSSSPSSLRPNPPWSHHPRAPTKLSNAKSHVVSPATALPQQ